MNDNDDDDNDDTDDNSAGNDIEEHILTCRVIGYERRFDVYSLQ